MSVNARDPLIRIRGLRKSFVDGGRARELFSALELEVGRGELLAIVGRSGSGKSTLLNLISGIDLPDAGSIDVDGWRVDTLSERERTLFRRRQIGFIFQFFNLVPTLTVAENVQLPLELNGIGGAAARERARRWLERVGVAERAASFPEILSGGEQQRVAVARALVNEPLLLLADEPTGNLDRESGEQVVSLLTALSREQGHTVVLVTHSAEVAQQTDRILRLAGGALETAAQ